LANAKPKLDSETLQEWFQACRIEARERLRERTDRVFRHLKEIDKRHEGKTIQVVLLSGRADVELLKLSELIKGRENRIAHRTVVLPVEAGGLTEEGTLDGSVKERAVDVAESDTTRMRLILKCRDDFYTVQRLDSIESHEDETEDRAQTEKPCKSPRDAAAQIAREESIARKNKMVVSLLVPLQEPPDGAEDEAERVFLLLLKQRKEEARDNPETAPSEKQPTLDEHTKQVVTQATRIGEALGLPKDLKQALVIAAKWHDRGKARRIWQRAIYNTNAEPLAKPGLRGMKPLRGYRHEFGSLLDAAKSDEVMQHPERDLILHLIAAHHGRARPHFESDAFGQERTTRENEETAHEVMRRFARLQQRFGHWGLAWLESLLWCADVAASRESAQFTSSEVNE
jgi:CRISPR-associated endonuclease/helicase Cas3